MPGTFHGHDVLELVAECAVPLRRDELMAEVARRFGADATFFTCKAQGLTAAELVAFFLSRGKLLELDGRVVGALPPCSHEHSQPCGDEGRPR